MIKTDFSYFIQQLWLHVNFSPIRKNEWKAAKIALLVYQRSQGVSQCKHLSFRVWIMHAMTRCLFWYQSEQRLYPGNKAFVCLLIYVNVSVLHPRGGAGLQSPDHYLRSYFSSFDFKGNCLRNKSSFKDFEVQETSKLLKAKTKKNNQNQKVSCNLGKERRGESKKWHVINKRLVNK